MILIINVTFGNANNMNCNFTSHKLKLNDNELNIYILKLYVEHKLCLNCDKDHYNLINYIFRYLDMERNK
jgi:hypothetical protein